MISRSEIEAKAQEFEIKISNVQRDYVFGWLLHGLFTVSELRGELFLKGGNALRKGYFEGTRYSNDLDLGIPRDIAPERLLEQLNLVCEAIGAKSGVAFVPEQNTVEEKFVAAEAPLPDLRVYEARVYFRDFYGNSDKFRIKVAMDVTRFDRTLLPIQDRPLIHPYSDAAEAACTIRCMKLEEIIATKLKCLLQRQHAPDLFDYVHSVRLLGADLDREEVVRTFIRKTIFARNPHVLKAILRATPFDYFRRYWVKGVVCAKSLLFGVEEAIAMFLGDLEALFSPYTDNGYAQFAYFGPELRVPIIKAARDQTLLRADYNGAERLLEPYSLKYMQKKDGAEREYLYVYNVSGGSSPPGIRSLVATGFQSIENTDQSFEPRHLIELSKAGELPEDRYLFDPNKPARAARPRKISVRNPFGITRRSRVASGIKYIYQCSFCGKRSTKSKQSSTLGPHKDKRGFACSGRTGYYVTTKY